MHSDRPMLIETICIQEGLIPLIDYHNQRANRSRAMLYDMTDQIHLAEYIDLSKLPAPTTKCRIIYDQYIRAVQYLPYRIKLIDSLQLVKIDSDYCYQHKYQNRAKLEQYYQLKKEKDDVLMVRDQLITDTYYGNVALHKNDLWYTPRNPLLQGTRRQSLLENKEIIESDITADSISTYDRIRVFNAMIGFGEIDLSVKNIFS